MSQPEAMAAPLTLVVTRGLPASGKTTWARRWVADAPHGRARLNRDDLRTMMFGGWTGTAAHEAAVTAAQHAAALALLRAGRSVVCDDTNLRPKYVEAFADLAATAGATFGVHDLTGVPLDVCLDRDAARAASGGAVGPDVIRSMHKLLAGQNTPATIGDTP